LRESLEDMEYADDVRLISHRFEYTQRKLDDLWEESKKVGLVICCVFVLHLAHTPGILRICYVFYTRYVFYVCIITW
jgi:hypothetical protein